MTFPWFGDIKRVDGKLCLVLRDREKFNGWIGTQFEEDAKVWVTVTKPSRDKTHRQFRYLFGAIYPIIAEEIGCSIEEADGIMCRRLLTMNQDSPLEFVRSKSSLDRPELANYIDGVRREAAGMGIETPDPPEGEG